MTAGLLYYRALVARDRAGVVDSYLAEGRFVLRDVLGQHEMQRLRLLWAHVHAHERRKRDFAASADSEAAELEEEVPNADVHLHAIGVVLPVFIGPHNADLVRLGLFLDDSGRWLLFHIRIMHV